ncbi:hypothetical protein [Sediminibacterium sp.]|uniref:hypothetical protein n=1 Tax=Sediminibacterium sp. TaxID=1917865 RepID=UPI003F71FD48
MNIKSFNSSLIQAFLIQGLGKVGIFIFIYIFNKEVGSIVFSEFIIVTIVVFLFNAIGDFGIGQLLMKRVARSKTLDIINIIPYLQIKFINYFILLPLFIFVLIFIYEFKIFYILFFIPVFFDTITNSYITFTQAKQNYAKYNLLLLVVDYSKLFSSFLGFYFFGLAGYIYFNITQSIILSLFCIRSNIFVLFKPIFHYTIVRLKSFWSWGFPFFISGSLVYIYNRLEVILIPILKENNVSLVYSGMFKLHEIITVIPSIFTGIYIPSALVLSISDRQLFKKKVSVFYFLASSLFLFIYFLFSEITINFYFNNNYSKDVDKYIYFNFQSIFLLLNAFLTCEIIINNKQRMLAKFLMLGFVLKFFILIVFMALNFKDFPFISSLIGEIIYSIITLIIIFHHQIYSNRFFKW